VRPTVAITPEMIAYAEQRVPYVEVRRTKASVVDTLTGILGELAFAEWLFGDWHTHLGGETKGRPDFLDSIEIKASCIPLSERLNLLVREDYAQRRQPDAYVQIIIDVPYIRPKQILAGDLCHIVGWATSDQVDRAEMLDFGRGYRCRAIPITRLQPMGTFPYVFV